MEKSKKNIWQKLISNKLSCVGILFIVALSLVAILGPFIRPDHTANANTQNLNISRQKPGFKVKVIQVKNDLYVENSWVDKWLDYGYNSPIKEIPIQSFTIKNDFIEIETYNPNGTKGDVQMVSFGDIPFKEDIRSIHLENAGVVYFKTYLLGTDRYGRDLLSRLMSGTVISLSVGFIAVAISILIGILLGSLAGYFGGWIDSIIMWLINVIWSIPTLLLVLAVVYAFGKGFDKVFIAVGLTMWVEVARIVRGQILAIKEREFIEAGRALGYSNARLITKHILPNIIGPVIVISAANFASAILIEAGLSFLGIGAQIPTPSWGNMIKEHYSFITTDLAYLAYLPGLLIMLLVLAFMLIGNGLRDAYDVKA